MAEAKGTVRDIEDSKLNLLLRVPLIRLQGHPSILPHDSFHTVRGPCPHRCMISCKLFNLCEAFLSYESRELICQREGLHLQHPDLGPGLGTIS